MNVGHATLLALVCAGCASAPPVPPAPAHPLRVGVVAMFEGPISPAEMAHLALWHPVVRAPIETAAQATAVLDQAAGNVSVILLVQTLDDALVTAIAPLCRRAIAVELGNELDGFNAAADVGDFVARSYATLRAAGFTGEIISGGVGNLDDGTLEWLADAGIDHWPADVILGWHAYSDWQTQIPALLALANGRPTAMTEWGYAQPTRDSEAWAATTVTADLALFAASGTRYALWYQIHDGPRLADHFGLVTLDGRWRTVEQSLIRAGRG